MKNSFDLTSIASDGGNKFVFKVAFCALLIALPLWLWQRTGFTHGLLCGVLAGTIDLSIMFLGIKKSLPYVDAPKQGLKIMKRFRWCRVAVAAAFVITMLRMKLAVHGAFGGFLLIHIIFLFNLLFIAYLHNHERA